MNNWYRKENGEIDREKVIDEMERDLVREPDEQTFIIGTFDREAVEAALELLKAQDQHVITKDDFSRCDDFGFIPAVFEPRNMACFLNWEWHLVTINDVSCKYGRYWTGLPTDEQRKAVKWE